MKYESMTLKEFIQALYTCSINTANPQYKAITLEAARRLTIVQEMIIVAPHIPDEENFSSGG